MDHARAVDRAARDRGAGGGAACQQREGGSRGDEMFKKCLTSTSSFPAPQGCGTGFRDRTNVPGR